MILLVRHAGPSKLPLFPPPQCGSSNPTHALIICPEKLAGDKHPIMALHPVPSASFHSFQITALITKLFRKTGWIPHFFCFFFIFLFRQFSLSVALYYFFIHRGLQLFLFDVNIADTVAQCWITPMLGEAC